MSHEYRPGRRQRTQVVAHVPRVGPVTAAGALLQTRDGGALMLLEHGEAGDLGGKIDPPDVCEGDPLRTAMRAVVREVREESGMAVEEAGLVPRFYFPRSKYLLFVADAPEPQGDVVEVRGVDTDAPDFLEALRAAVRAQTGRPLHKRLCFPIEKIAPDGKPCPAR